jgi:hypothetical protein
MTPWSVRVTSSSGSKAIVHAYASGGPISQHTRPQVPDLKISQLG